MSPIRWEAPGPYAVAFSTRSGGVSEAPFDTLNLGRLTGDEPERVAENRLRLTWQGRHCDFDVELPAGSPDEIPRVGPYVCSGVSR